MNYSTAKSILHLYKAEGRLGNDRSKHIDLCLKKQFASDQLHRAMPVESGSFSDLLFEKLRSKRPEEPFKKKDAFTCLLHQQLNTVMNKPQGFLKAGHCGNQRYPKAIISSPTVFNYSPQDFLMGLQFYRRF